MSVRNLVEFILRSGDLDNSKGGVNDYTLMQQGAKLHKKIQNSMGVNYRAEVSLNLSRVVSYMQEEFEIEVEGRADGIITPDLSKSCEKSYIMDNDVLEDRTIYIVDEIKGVMAQVAGIEEPVIEHLGQAKCYAYIFALENDLDEIKVRITYCNLESFEKKYFTYTYEFVELEKWYDDILYEYAKWIKLQSDWEKIRTASIKEMEFPFDYRVGQKNLAASVYTTIVRNKKIYIEAPTGVGKTISTIFPSVKAMGEGKVEKIFYVTAKNITRTVAVNTFNLLKDKGLKFKSVVITAKEKICILDKPDCNPRACERACGHFDRVNDAVYDMLSNENDINKDIICEYATKHKVCPFEMCLDATLWSDAVVCDYNYVFDPDVYLRRFFEGDKKKNYVFLIDEAHNLVDRACRMYSASLVKEKFLTVKNYVKNLSPSLAKALEASNKILLGFKRECDESEVLDIEHIGSLHFSLMHLMTKFDEFFKDKRVKENPGYEGKEEVLDLFFDVRKFVGTLEYVQEDYLIYDEFASNGDFIMTIRCMNPARRLKEYLSKGISSVFFSATLLPINYYKNQLSFEEGDYAIYVESPFDASKRLIMIGNNVSTKYSRRNESEYKRIVRYIGDFIEAKMGNYLVFFPSYKMLEDVYSVMCAVNHPLVEHIVLTDSSFNEDMREEFLKGFVENPRENHIGFCVMGGVFSEGIDLVRSRLIGAVIVGTGLPMVCNERELTRGYYDDNGGNGFEYAYLYDGMNKVMQSAGRVIRTKEDVGAILLLDERFMNVSYSSLFPHEWYPYKIVNENTMKKELTIFWSEVDKLLG